MVRQIEEITGVGAWSWSRGQGLTGWSDQFYRVLGVSPGSAFTVEDFFAAIHPADLETVQNTLFTVFPRNGIYALDHRVIRPDGDVRWVHVRARAEIANSSVVQAIGTIQDISETRGVARDLARVRDLFADALDGGAEQSIIGIDPNGVITLFNTGAERMLGYQAAEMLGAARLADLHDPAELLARSEREGCPADFRAVVGRAVQAEPEVRRWTYLTQDGLRKQVTLSVTASRGRDGEVTGYVLVGTDTAIRANAEQALSVSEALFEEVFDHAGTGILLLEIDGTAAGRIFRVNPALCRITGYSERQLLAMTATDLVHPEHRDAVPAAIEEFLSERSLFRTGEQRWMHADGHDVWVHFSTTKVRHSDANFLVCMADDVSVRKEVESRLSHMAMHDVLTGLPNRSLLFDRVEHALAATSRSKHVVALYYLDLDGFKEVNDQAGHLAGDQVLKMVAQRLSRHVRPGDTVSRLGGDEFVVLCPDFPAGTDPRGLAQRLLALLSEPYPWDGRVHRLSASIGVAVSSDANTASELLRRADAAMYNAKDAGKNRVHYSPGVDSVSAGGAALAARQVQMEAELQAAIEDSQFVLHGQPVLDLPTGHVVAVEMLIRWHHPVRGLLAPIEFLDVAENSPVINLIGRWVLEEACRIAKDLPVQPDGSRPDVFVNVSGRQLESGQLCGDVTHALREARLPAHRLVLELTESTTPLINGALLQDIQALRKRGVRIAIDDLGTGYSSLSRLTELPVDMLKIDRSFVSRIGQHSAVDAVVRAIVSIAAALRLEVVAEGVETADQEALLEELGCHLVQGFRYSVARPEAELRGLVGRELLGAHW